MTTAGNTTIVPAAWRYWQDSPNGGGYWVLIDASAAPVVAQSQALEPLYDHSALLAEREQCARIAEGEMGVPSRQRIAASIRGTSKSEGRAS